MDSDDVGRHFEALLARYKQLITHQIRTRITKARDKQYALKSQRNLVDAIMFDLNNNPHTGEIARSFIVCFKEGENIALCLEGARDLYLEEILPGLISKSETNLVQPSGIRKQPLDGLLTKRMIQYIAFAEIQENYDELFRQPEKAHHDVKAASTFQVVWTSLVATKENKNDFVQLIYGLHKAGYINHGEGEITRIVETLAKALNLKLGDNWQSNLSASIHKAKRDYQPLVFKNIQQAYMLYMDNLIEGKRKTGGHLRKVG